MNYLKNCLYILNFTIFRSHVDEIEQLKADQDDLYKVSVNGFAYYALNSITSSLIYFI